MKIYLFRTPKPKQFHIKTRYYDEDAEEMKRRKMELGIIDKDSADDPEIRMRAEMRRKWRNEDRAKRKRSDIQRMVIFAVIILILLYFIFIK